MELSKLKIEELLDMLSTYPWFAAARKELALRTGQFEDAALYVANRRILFDAVNGRESIRRDAAVPSAAPLLSGSDRKVRVVGGDYFSQERYDKARQNEDNVFRSFAKLREDNPAPVPESQEIVDICTETLALIYAEQGYVGQAKEIYSKLSLRYPEKSVYFASLIQNLEEINN